MSTIHPELRTLLTIAVTVEDYTGQDSVGNNTYDTARTVYARPENPTRTMLQALADPGTQLADPGRMLRLIVDYDSTAPIQERARVTLGDDTYTVVSVLTEYDENGPYYQDLTCENNKER